MPRSCRRSMVAFISRAEVSALRCCCDRRLPEPATVFAPPHRASHSAAPITNRQDCFYHTAGGRRQRDRAYFIAGKTLRCAACRFQDGPTIVQASRRHVTQYPGLCFIPREASLTGFL